MIRHGVEARTRLLRGALKLARVVGVTYGPQGRHCMLQRMAGLLVTRDGVTVAQEVAFADPLEDMGARILKEACLTVNRTVGDGTTTTTIVASEILRRAHKLILAGEDPMTLARQIQTASLEVAALIRGASSLIREEADICRVASLASNGDQEIAGPLAEAAMAIGSTGTILVEDDPGVEVRVEFKEGMDIDRGPVRVSCLGSAGERKMLGPLVAVVNAQLTRVEDVQELLECGSQWAPREILIFARGVSGEALKTVLQNDSRGVVKSVALLCPGFGPHQEDYLRDVAAVAGATFVTRAAGQDPRVWNSEWFGSVREATIREKTTLLIPYEDKAAERDVYITSLQREADLCESDFNRDLLRERIARVAGSLALLRVGGVTEVARKERRARVEDALAAVRAALRGGVVPGAGTSLMRASLQMETETLGALILQQALLGPLRTLASSRPGIVDEVSSLGAWWGWDVLQDRIRDLQQEPPIMDPTEVVVSTLEAATSVAALLLTVEVAVTHA